MYLELNGPNWTNGSEDWMGDEDSCNWLVDNNQGTCNDEFLVENDVFYEVSLPQVFDDV